MKIAVAKTVFNAGAMRSVTITPSPLAKGWGVLLKQLSGEDATLETDKGEVRTFKTLDAAFRAVEEIGFDHAQVVRK